MAPASSSRRLDQFFRNAPRQVDVGAIRREWSALKPPYAIDDRHLPLPVWTQRPFTDNGVAAWQALGREVPAIDPDRAFCIYVHVPFCAERCGFCDCYAFRLRSHRETHVERYVDVLAREAQIWSGLGTLAARPVSTVHLGGGTPTFLGKESVAKLVSALSDSFAAGPDTEWALESGVTELTSGMLAHLHSLGFTRLHIGVQSLQDDVRARIGRRAAASQVRDTIAIATSMGWIVSVDLICGLPGQTLAGLVDGVHVLSTTGINGFSLYELQISSRNRRFAEAHGLAQQDRHDRYFLAQAAAQRLEALGYRKTLFNHFADERDTNLYFTFPERGEDCLALGAIADGSFGDYHYRHPEYAAYCREDAAYRRGSGLDLADRPVLQGGLRRNELENHLQPLTTALLAGRVPNALAGSAIDSMIWRQWQASRLLVEETQTGDLVLTGNGSWFVGNMITEMRRASSAL